MSLIFIALIIHPAVEFIILILIIFKTHLLINFILDKDLFILENLKNGFEI